MEEKWIPEIDLSYAWSRSLSAELVLTTPQRHDVYLRGAGRLGSSEHLPPTLSLSKGRICLDAPIDGLGQTALPFVRLSI